MSAHLYALVQAVFMTPDVPQGLLQIYCCFLCLEPAVITVLLDLQDKPDSSGASGTL